MITIKDIKKLLKNYIDEAIFFEWTDNTTVSIQVCKDKKADSKWTVKSFLALLSQYNENDELYFDKNLNFTIFKKGA